MFLNLAHTKLDVFVVGKNFVLSCYKISKLLPQDEKFNMTRQLRRAALSVQLNIAEGSSRKSAIERRRFFEISRGSLIEIDTIFDIAVELGYFKKEEIDAAGVLMVKTFQMLSKMIVYQKEN
ncbi:MAG: four helix bundle protein [Bacteroidetes bacterium]|nr:four helix bundle protein [Bacteroidota bacterium]